VKWDITGNIARIGTKHKTLVSYGESAMGFAHLREALSSTSVYAAINEIAKIL
jgi:hypothetical protein